MKENPIYGNKGHEITITEGGKEITVRNPISIYQLALMEYSPDLDLEVIVLFEKLLVFHRLSRFHPFNYQQDRLKKELHIKTTRLNKARAFLMNLDILNEVNHGKGKKIIYSLNNDKIIAAVPILYKLPVDERAREDRITELQSFFRFYLSRHYLRNASPSSIPDYILEGRFNIVTKNALPNSSEYEDKNVDNDQYKEKE